ncbi:hypothetical protein DQ04_08641020, partial [Trypanosoma grayi]|uniref:hypothetical protein n=1 Tax=Trypanosoma grayi TaxID=71804 RepID=UPI0004F48636
ISSPHIKSQWEGNEEEMSPSATGVATKQSLSRNGGDLQETGVEMMKETNPSSWMLHRMPNRKRTAKVKSRNINEVIKCAIPTLVFRLFRVFSTTSSRHVF